MVFRLNLIFELCACTGLWGQSSIAVSAFELGHGTGIFGNTLNNTQSRDGGIVIVLRTYSKTICLEELLSRGCACALYEHRRIDWFVLVLALLFVIVNVFELRYFLVIAPVLVPALGLVHVVEAMRAIHSFWALCETMEFVAQQFA